ncbi:head-tail adaptor protein [Candidatus Dojkabacteria bacterium]|uniref:Head-tail adaptor protein n=1 Tax=Candidatus Dojkabacteria bacterium TaxID=2099670 RepID=A0A5C7JAI2_9BACT|nr:MAG: head-tail adaptor protein [Candidatus Dojkabacteria bacterium]
MRAGRLRHQVVLQRYVITQDEYGQKNEAWTDYATVWAGVEPGSNAGAYKEYFAAQQTINYQHAVIVLRYRADVSVDDRVVFGSVIYQIAAVVDREHRHQELLIMGKLTK